MIDQFLTIVVVALAAFYTVRLLRTLAWTKRIAPLGSKPVWCDVCMSTWGALPYWSGLMFDGTWPWHKPMSYISMAASSALCLLLLNKFGKHTTDDVVLP